MELLTSYKALLKNQDGDLIEQGEWLIVYDETFEVTFPSHEFFAKFKYLAKSFSDESYTSICNETQEGWYDDTSLGKKGCFYAYKNENSKQNLVLTEPEKELLRGIDKQQLEKEIKSILNIAKSHASWEFKFSIEQQKILKDINKIKSLSLSSSNFINDINERSDISKYSDSKINRVIKEYKNSIPSTNKFYKRFSTPINEFPDNELPEKFSWRNVDGVNYCPTVKNQDCGNCYAIASAAALESRLHIAMDKPVAIFDTVELIKCNMFSEGCEGGFPYGVNKYLKDFGIHEAECAQNRQANCAGIQESCKNHHLYKIKEHALLNSFYSTGDSTSFMKEVYLRGPISVSIDATLLQYYESGVFDCNGLYDGLSNFQLKILKALSNNFNAIGHSVLLVGWGREGNKDYWELQNSWGEGFGDKGFFKIKRGINECGVESLVDAVFPNLDNL